MEVEAREDSGIARKLTRARSYVWPIAIVGIVALGVVGVFHYGETFTRSSAFQDERSFRVLEQISEQVDYLESSRASLLATVPDPVIERMPDATGDSGPEASTPKELRHRLPPDVEKELRQRLTSYAQYVARLDFPDSRLCKVTRASSVTGGPPRKEPPGKPAVDPQDRCKGVEVDGVGFIFDIQSKQLTSVLCRQAKEIVLQEPFPQKIKRSISQDFFDEALLAMQDGTVVGEFPAQSSDVRDGTVLLHSAVAEEIDVINASALLHPPESAAIASRAGDTKADAEKTQPAPLEHRQPLAQNTTVREQPYRASILPINAPYHMAVARRTGPNEYFYVIGLRRIDHTRDILHALWPVGLWAVVLVIGLNLVAWPLLTVALGPPEESISPVKAVGCVLGLLVVPAILIIAAASLWSDFEIDSLMRSRASVYAKDVITNLQHDLIDGAEILGSFRPVYRPFLDEPWFGPPTCANVRNLPSDSRSSLHQCADAAKGNPPWLSYGEQRRPRNACAVDIKPESCQTIRLSSLDAHDPIDRWSQFRSIIAVNEEGDRFGPAFTPFADLPVKDKLNLDGREYFKALKFGQAWTLDMAKGRTEQLVAQRLFNRADGSKSLQLAIPLCNAPRPGDDAEFCGIITGDLRMHSLMASIRPPLLKFVVIDTATGTVLFGSDDSRSLFENFFLESERDPALQAAISSRQMREFRGRYLGDPHRFVYAPLRNVPWGVVVFYSEKDVADLPFRAGAGALCAYAGVLLALAVIAYLLRWLIELFKPGMLRPVALVRRAWPRIPLSATYRNMSRFRPSVWVLVLLLSSLWELSYSQSLGIAFAVLIVASLLGFRFKPTPQAPSRRTPAQQYGECILVVLTAISIIPAYGLYLAFHRLQLDALVRDGLVQNTMQIQARYDVIQQDIRRWIDPEELNADVGTQPFPDVWTLVLHPNAGMSDSEHDLPPSVWIKHIESSEAGPALPQRHPSMITALVWWSIVGSLEQERRLALLDVSPLERTAATHSRDLVCGAAPQPALDKCVARMADGTWVSVEAGPQRGDTLLEQDFDWMWVRLVSLSATAIALAIGVSYLVRTFTVRLLGLSAHHVLNPPPEPQSVTSMDPDAFGRTWAGLGHSEQLILYQIASGHLANPRNESGIEHLLAAGLIRLDPWPALRLPELKPLILRAQSTAEFEQWQHDAARGVWKTIRIPLFIVLMIIIAWLSWAAGGSMQAVSAILAAAIAFLGQVVQLFNFARGGSAPKPGAG